MLAINKRQIVEFAGLTDMCAGMMSVVMKFNHGSYRGRSSNSKLSPSRRAPGTRDLNKNTQTTITNLYHQSA
jgi:hypothetical protein